MNKAELATAIANKTGKTQIQARIFIDAFMDTVEDVLKNGDKITLVGFGTFDVQSIAGRTGRNPRTGEVLQIKPKKKIRFKAGTDLADKVN